ncbi:MAG: diaminopimelate decarboxylase [Sphingobacteriales bacterium SCN 48-20]|uniref:diaminopimelate decarboxylase n=1 Tax=Terrimonas ferruginea TaxID=249 RepID=UPI00086B9294|nr:diaminopimelate decarboxylase [Terrimonas ferruginea]MBN8783159.1 diaminopimelate decarboxylase [Terrimonas ferruginea]ODT92646.1 MAG: diaminopimelate decarboxylase [Sphingobacteriales bacterium SCN 48-20]OJW39786.1 MAG: diaminopimelate decarboxylase [Sphingobacteriales bacterium 48-107]
MAQLAPEQLTQLAAQFGTPLYVYHADKIREQYKQLTTAFNGSNVVFFYACKALTNIHILRFVRDLGANVDCSSINEVKLALHAGFPAQRVLYTSNGISFDEIEEAVSLGVNINIDSLSNLAKFGKRFGHDYPVGLRLRPNIMAGGNLKISTGHDKSKFGIPVEQLEELLAVIREHNLHITNLHIHTGSEIKDVEVFVKGIGVLFDILHHFPELRSIDLGGGFKVPYKEGDGATDIPLLAQKVKEAFGAHPAAQALQIWFEPGKFIVSECGYFITSVNVIKETAAATFVSVNSGFNHLIRPMFYDSFHRIINISNPQGPVKNYAVVGNICETDTFAWDRELPEVREGDLLVFLNAGAYGFEMSSSFNSRYKPAEVMVNGDEVKLIRERSNFEDLLRGQVPLAP